MDLGKELAPNGLHLTFEDVRLIVGVLYCMGTVEISPQRIESLLLMAQVMGIPTLITFLKRIKDSLNTSSMFDYQTFPSTSTRIDHQTLTYPVPPPAPAPVPPPVVQNGRRDLSPMFGATNRLFSHSAAMASNVIEKTEPASPRKVRTPMSDDNEGDSRPQSMASFGSFALQTLPSPRDGHCSGPVVGNTTNATISHPSRAVSSVLDSFDPSFLNNLPANQIDDLENALLPHLHNDESSSQFGPIQRNRSVDDRKSVLDTQCPPEASMSTTSANANSTLSREPLNLSKTGLHSSSAICGIRMASEEDVIRHQNASNAITTEASNVELPRFIKLLPNSDVGNERPEPVVLKPNQEPSANSQENRETAEEPPETEVMPERSDNDDDDNDTPVTNSNEENSSDPKVTNKDKDAENQTSTPSKDNSKEVQVYLETESEGQSLKLALPGGSESVTLNFSADAIKEMRESVTKQPGESNENASQDKVSAGETIPKPKAFRNNKKKGVSRKQSLYSCHFCSKSFSTKTLLDRHLSFHVEINTSCKICGKIFTKKWSLDEHLAVDHKEGKSLSCQECGKAFKWERNLLAHMHLYHQEEKRRRCKFCPLTFLKRKFYINHQKTKHPDQPPTWCQVITVWN